jgi:hypothetical protein
MQTDRLPQRRLAPLQNRTNLRSASLRQWRVNMRFDPRPLPVPDMSDLASQITRRADIDPGPLGVALLLLVAGAS